MAIGENTTGLKAGNENCDEEFCLEERLLPVFDPTSKLGKVGEVGERAGLVCVGVGDLTFRFIEEMGALISRPDIGDHGL